MIDENPDNSATTIGYAEDQRWFRDDVVKMLEDKGFRFVAIAYNDKELIDQVVVLANIPDIFLTDLSAINIMTDCNSNNWNPQML
ncbi:hypothetical protein H7U22_22355 [Pedobacter sp. CCM 8938]|uniref:Uncharacterized protein n=2 Tax=Pedobacter fastidiosus TaxID=2765361 RepID=A0ABR7KZH1_9SPHI|nr:hypothetical protein [Pedobacter fastidiosus]MBC6113167.1 hypothetical protein [Pedobacter fastidiosus]